MHKDSCILHQWHGVSVSDSLRVPRRTGVLQRAYSTGDISDACHGHIVVGVRGFQVHYYQKAVCGRRPAKTTLYWIGGFCFLAYKIRFNFFSFKLLGLKLKVKEIISSKPLCCLLILNFFTSDLQTKPKNCLLYLELQRSLSNCCLQIGSDKFVISKSECYIDRILLESRIMLKKESVNIRQKKYQEMMFDT